MENIKELIEEFMERHEELKDFEKELKKLQRMNPSMSDYSVQRSYLELILDLPWNEYTKDDFDLSKANKILNRDHFGLEEVKKRIHVNQHKIHKY